VAFVLRAGRGAPTATGSRASYPDALPGVEVRYTALADAVKEELVLSGPDAPTSYTYDLQMSEGLSASENPHGGIDVKDARGSSVFFIPPPAVWDAANPIRPDASATIQLGRDRAGQTLTIAIGRDWLQAPVRTFPVVVDPPSTPAARPPTPAGS
jgi:hypothetical protein